jgi:hypothetical protein
MFTRNRIYHQRETLNVKKTKTTFLFMGYLFLLTLFSIDVILFAETVTAACRARVPATTPRPPKATGANAVLLPLGDFN